MTAFDRIEQRMPDLMGELAPAKVPDYFDDMLRQTAGTRQRPAWSSPERWLPMGTIARIQPARQLPWRPLVIAAVLVALAAALALYAGSQRKAVPPPFGPAVNGDVLIGNNGDITGLEIATGVTRPVIAGSAFEVGPVYAPDGRSFLYESIGAEPGIWIAAADGSNGRRLFDTTGLELSWSDWSQSGDRIVLVGRDSDPGTVVVLVDPDGGQPVRIRTDRAYKAAMMPFGREQLVLSAGLPAATGPESHEFWLMDLADQDHPRLLPASPDALNALALSPDGSQLVYATWADGLGIGMNLHVLDLGTMQDRLVTTEGNETYGWQEPQFLPDGTSIIADQWRVGGTFELGIVPAEGGSARGIGPVRTQQSGGADWYVSPDGRTVVATYKDDGVGDGVMWQIDIATGVGTQLPLAWPEQISWQRAGE